MRVLCLKRSVSQFCDEYMRFHWEARPMDTDQRAKIAGHARAIAALGRNRPRTGENPCWDRRSRARASAPTLQSRNCKFLIRTSSDTQAGREGRIHSGCRLSVTRNGVRMGRSVACCSVRMVPMSLLQKTSSCWPGWQFLGVPNSA